MRLQSFGISTKIISKVGQDDNGGQLLKILKDKFVDVSQIQVDAKIKTGEVLVTLNSTRYSSDIVIPSAWDKIELNEENINLVKNSDIFVFDYLVCRDNISKSTLYKLLPFAKHKIFDVNLRAPFYSFGLIVDLMNKSDFIKMNDEELLIIAVELGSKYNSIEENIKFISDKTNTQNICITKGKDGAVLFIENEFYHNNGFNVKVEDTVGAGDSFLAALIYKLQTTNNYYDSLEFACAVSRNGSITQRRKSNFNADDTHTFINTKND